MTLTAALRAAPSAPVLDELDRQRDIVVGRELEILALLAEQKRAWIVDKDKGDFGLRTTLEAEYARLNVAKHALNRTIAKHRRDAKEFTTSRVLGVLKRLCTERGMGDWVTEANFIAEETSKGVPT